MLFLRRNLELFLGQGGNWMPLVIPVQMQDCLLILVLMPFSCQEPTEMTENTRRRASLLNSFGDHSQSILAPENKSSLLYLKTIIVGFPGLIIKKTQQKMMRRCLPSMLMRKWLASSNTSTKFTHITELSIYFCHGDVISHLEMLKKNTDKWKLLQTT